MPEVIVVIAMAVCLIFGIAAFVSYDPCVPCGIALTLVFGALLAWEIVAQKYHEIESEKTYKVTTVGENPTEIRQVAVTENNVIDVTANTNKIVDEEKCKILISEYETFSCGMLMMFGVYDKYSVVCPEIE